MIVFHFQNHLAMIKGWHSCHIRVEQIDRSHPGTQLFVKCDTHFFCRMQIGFTDIVHKNDRPQKVDRHFPINIVEKT